MSAVSACVPVCDRCLRPVFRAVLMQSDWAACLCAADRLRARCVRVVLIGRSSESVRARLFVSDVHECHLCGAPARVCAHLTL